jgi:hypothetical protein
METYGVTRWPGGTAFRGHSLLMIARLTVRCNLPEEDFTIEVGGAAELKGAPGRVAER